MSIPIDGAGRLVIPKSIRDELNLVPGSELEIDASGTEIRLRLAGSEPSLIRKSGVVVHHGAGKADVDIAAFIHAEREKGAAAEVGVSA